MHREYTPCAMGSFLWFLPLGRAREYIPCAMGSLLWFLPLGRTRGNKVRDILCSASLCPKNNHPFHSNASN